MAEVFYKAGDKVLLRDTSPEAKDARPTPIGTVVARITWEFTHRLQTKYRVNFMTNTGYTVFNSEIDVLPEQLLPAPSQPAP